MTLFSEREGFKPVKSVFQLEEVDLATRNGLWNIFESAIIESEKKEYFFSRASPDFRSYIHSLWHSFYKLTYDTLGDNIFTIASAIKGRFFKCNWYEVYDFLEFTLANSGSARRYDLGKEFNNILEREVTGYRLVGNIVAAITSPSEISEIEEGLEGSKGKINAVSKHLQRALELLSDKTNPDYRNSIKESISAVESLCKILAQNENATLGPALKSLEVQVSFHPALKSAFLSLYGYTSDEKGIRHALMEEDNINFEDAKFMLTACSAFINYMKSKAGRANFPLE